MYADSPYRADEIVEDSFSLGDLKNQAAGVLLVVLLGLLFLEQNIVAISLVLLGLAFLYHPKRVSVRGRYDVPVEELML